MSLLPLIRNVLLRSGAQGKRIQCACRCVSSAVPKVKVDDFHVKNEPCLTYGKGTKERKELEAALRECEGKCQDVPIVIGSEEFRTDDVRYQVIPFDHQKRIAKYYYANADLLKKAIEVAKTVQPKWEAVPLENKIQMYMKAADLMSTKYRMALLTTTMLGQAKTAVQAEIDAAAELIDFFRFNAFFAKETTKYQPMSENPHQSRNWLRYRGLEGFVAAVSPFNFTAIGGNLAYAPALMGCTVLWKPSDTAILSNYTIFQVVKEAGFPSGVVNFVPADGPVFGDVVTQSADLAGINFTGSVPTFRRLWMQVGQNVSLYHNFPRLVGECGGKNYHFVHPSANVDSVVPATIRSAFDYSGQKCSACSRLYVPNSLWPKIKEGLLEIHSKLQVGPATNFSNFTSAVIDGKAFNRIRGYLEHAKSSPNLEILAGGSCDDSVGYFVQPTIVESKDPMDSIMREEIFGPVLAAYVYPDGQVEQALRLVKDSTPYALTGAIFGNDQDFLNKATEFLRVTAGNFYINDKSTGSVVGQQPFGGSRNSGTNDKAGGPHYVLRWASPQSIKETFVPLTDWQYPHMK